MNAYSFFFLDTGRFTGAVRRTNRPIEAIRAPDGQGVRLGEFDHLSQKIELATSEVVDYQPPAPDADHEWIHDDDHGNRVRRWRLKPEVAERQARRAAALARIADLERKQERAVREHLLGVVPTDEDRAAGAMTLQEIQDEIARLRLEVNGE